MDPEPHPQGGALVIERSTQSHEFSYHHTMEFWQSCQLLLHGHRNCSPNACAAKWGLLYIRHTRHMTFPIPASDDGWILDGTRNPRRVEPTGIQVSYQRPPDLTAAVAAAG